MTRSKGSNENVSKHQLNKVSGEIGARNDEPSDDDEKSTSHTKSATLSRVMGKNSNLDLEDINSQGLFESTGKSSSIWKALKNAQIFTKNKKKTKSRTKIYGSIGSGSKSPSSDNTEMSGSVSLSPAISNQDFAKTIFESPKENDSSKFNSSSNNSGVFKSSLTKSSTESILRPNINKINQRKNELLLNRRRFSSSPNITHSKLNDAVNLSSNILDKSSNKISDSQSMSSNQGNVSYSLEGNRVSFDNFSSFSFDDEHEQLSQYYDADFKSNNAYFKKEFKNVSKKFERELQKFIKDYSSIYISNPFESIWTTKLVELAKSCLSAIVNDSLNLAFFYEIMDNIENLINEILKKDRRKMNGMNNKISRLSLIISTPCRLMEIIETDAEDIINRLQYLETNNPEQSDNIKKYMTQQTRAPTDFVDKSWQIKSDVTLKKHHSYIDISKVVDIEDFKHVKDLSKGKFGTTTLVQYKDSGLQFAMKKIKKSSYVRKNQVNSLFAERDIQFYLNSIYIANLFGTFVSEDSVYFLMEYVTAGDLGKYMDNNILQDEEILKISAELVLALQFLHSKEIVHRDLKPENILLTEKMSIRLVDFGLSALALKYELSHLTTWKKQSSFVGTPFYIAPEVLLNTDYGRPVDWWALGIIIFEMHYGTPPYLGDSICEIFHAILEDTLQWPDDQHNEEPVIAASPAAKATISRLLVKLPSDRLGTNDDYLVSKHKYFANVDWTNLLSEIEADSALCCKSNDDNDTQVVYRNRNRNSVMSEDRVSVSSKLETDKVMHDFSVVSQKMIDLINRTRQNDQKKA